MKLSIICNVDTRPGMFAPFSTVGRYGEGSLQGVRGWDMLTFNVENKLLFFRGFEIELIIVCDIHEPIPEGVITFWNGLKERYGCELQIHAIEFNRTFPRWNDRIELFGYHKATGEIIIHCDQDVSCFKRDDFDIQTQWFNRLINGEVKFICQPSKLWPHEHQMTHCSTRFAICLRDALNWEEVDRCLDNDYRIARWGNHHAPCLEFIFGIMANSSVDYPKTENFEECAVWSWVHYYAGTLEKLNEMTYNQILEYIDYCGGIHGPNDLLGKGI